MPHTPEIQSRWKHVAQLRPRLRRHVRLYPQQYRGDRWYVLQDESSGRYLRVNAAAYEIIGRMDGDLTVQEIWDQISTVLGDEGLGDEGLSQDDLIDILAQLYAANVLTTGVRPDTQQLFRHHLQRPYWRRALLNPLALRVRLLDPDRMLTYLSGLARPAFSSAGLAIWLVVVGAASLLALVHSAEIVDAISGGAILSPQNLLLVSLAYLAMKVLHELGHGIAVKIWGGEVHDMGITLLVLMPVPYVDASAAWGFQDKRRRAVVGAAGILVEIFLAALGLFVWLAVEPGTVRDTALDVALIGGVSTLLFNGNPLLRFDAYYVLEDLIEIPNLASRASRYYLYLVQRYVFGLGDVHSPVTAKGERAWFLFYGVASHVYRLIALSAITLFLTVKFMVAGAAIATWVLSTQVLLPIVRGLRFIIASPRLAARRARAVAVTTAGLSSLAAVLLFLPVPLITGAEGMVWVTEQAQVFAGTDGFVREVLAPSGTAVEVGDPILRIEDPLLDTRIAVVAARLAELRAQRAAERLESRLRLAITDEAIAAVEAELSRVREQAAALFVKSPTAGTFVPPSGRWLEGRFVHQGEVVGVVVDPHHFIVRAVVPQSDIGLVRTHNERVEIRLAEHLDRVFPAQIVREVPSGTAQLPSRILGAAGGGEIPIDTHDEQGLTAAEKVFQVELGLPPDIPVVGIGGRVYVRFHHGTEPLARQWARAARQLLLSKLAT